MPTVMHDQFESEKGRLSQPEVDALFDALSETGEVLPMSYRKACLIFGDGDFRRGQQNIFMLARRLEEARKKHPHFAEGVYQGLGVVGAEYQEFVHAVEHETYDRQLDEALDVAVTTLRFINREYKIQTRVIKRG